MVTHRGISGNTEGTKKHPQSQLGQAIQSLAKNAISFISYISFIGALAPCLTPGPCFNRI